MPCAQPDRAWHRVIHLKSRMFIVGPNASGKSNLLDVFRFIRDIAKPGGGFQQAIQDRGGISKLRCLAARNNPNIEIKICLSEFSHKAPIWTYAIGIIQEPRGYRQPILSYERVWRGDALLLNRPDKDDEKDGVRLTQTHLEQISANQKFRDIAKFFESIQYLHLIPQFIRHPDAFSGPNIAGDPFGRNFLDNVARTPEKVRRARLSKIENVLRVAVPQLQQLSYVQDEVGASHLEAIYEHWRPKGAKQQEDQFSDGTLRLIGLLWMLLEEEALLLLEEPELSLHAQIVKKLPPLLYQLQKSRKRQILLSTHSADLLSDNGIGAEEVIMLIPESESTQVQTASTKREIKALLESGMNLADAVFPFTAPKNLSQLPLCAHELNSNTSSS